MVEKCCLRMQVCRDRLILLRMQSGLLAKRMAGSMRMFIFFYGRGNSFWDYDTTSRTIKRYSHLYSKENFYWITFSGTNGKRIQEKPGLNTTPTYTQTSTEAFADWDVD